MQVQNRMLPLLNTDQVHKEKLTVTIKSALFAGKHVCCFKNHGCFIEFDVTFLLHVKIRLLFERAFQTGIS